MTEVTQRPWGYVHHKGLDKHLVGGVLENVAIVEDRHGNAKENAEFIVKAVNNHDALVAALEFISSAIHSDEWDEMGALLEAIDKSATAALARGNTMKDDGKRSCHYCDEVLVNDDLWNKHAKACALRPVKSSFSCFMGAATTRFLATYGQITND